ncbi:carbohydrate ABC transporter permease [Paenibacillus allorhizosphaerae]|uniref:ABC transmembrane type-1 domain-containing protein n=1 Tax=Paenibacillus allorhizosphaerae TaxID=2849866 RepID=A0ABN7TFM9_9BACL|nr:carbohydrate ABC transporter permease [Paenibacillus allorhizosphaerae]CAG7625050.1 hypothetical protein PAECIP111802_01125 [Paenibacillus allorhizosphaerae]
MDRSREDRMFDRINVLLLVLITIIVLYPLLFVLSASVSDPSVVVKGQLWLWPKGFNLAGYERVFQNNDIVTGYGNTILYTVVGTAINVVLTICAAYPLSRKDFRGRHVITALITFTLFFSGGLIPTYLLVKKLGMLGTIWALVIPNAVAVWNIIIMRTFFQTSIPYEVQESAAIDGCSNFRILLSIVLPLSMPIIAVMVLFYAVGHWNAFFNALIYLNDRSQYPLQLILREILLQGQMQAMIDMADDSLAKKLMEVEGIKYAVVVIANLPVLVLYPFLQKYFVKGMMIGALKG